MMTLPEKNFFRMFFEASQWKAYPQWWRTLFLIIGLPAFLAAFFGIGRGTWLDGVWFIAFFGVVGIGAFTLLQRIWTWNSNG